MADKPKTREEREAEGEKALDKFLVDYVATDVKKSAEDAKKDKT